VLYALAITPLPTATYVQNNQSAIVPDWTKITFGKLPRFEQGGAVVPTSTETFGPAPPIRQWQRGESVEQVLTLGDFQDSFKLQDLDLFAIAIQTKTVPSEVALSDFRLIQRQTIQSLLSAIPTLEQVPIQEIKPVNELLSATFSQQTLATLTLHDLIEQDSAIGELRFTTINLSHYQLTDIPGLLNTPLAAFKDWQQAKISDIPKLSDVVWSAFPDPPVNTGSIGSVQMNAKGKQSISGGDMDDYRTACRSSCSAISFTGNDQLSTKQWNLETQEVQGGQDNWKGMEPTGRKPYSNAFKVAIKQTTPNEIEAVMYFKACDLTHCSPYSIGAIPLMSIHEGDSMLVGEIPTDKLPEPPSARIDSPKPIRSSQNQPSISLFQQFQIWVWHFLS